MSEHKESHGGKSQGGGHGGSTPDVMSFAAETFFQPFKILQGVVKPDQFFDVMGGIAGIFGEFLGAPFKGKGGGGHGGGHGKGHGKHH